MRATLGLVVNPASGKDIRRLVANGAVFGNREKINYAVRLLRGLESSLSFPASVVYMPDPYELIDTAASECSHALHRVSLNRAPITVFGDETDTERFTSWAVEEGARAIVVVGGDGTNRVVAKRCGDVPLFPLSAGTNNVFAENIEPTVVGMAAGFYLSHGHKREKTIQRTKVLKIREAGGREDMALVDAVLLDQRERGARAVWDIALVKLVVVTHTDPLKVGLSSLVGRVAGVDRYADGGAYVRLGGKGKSIAVPIAPGLVKKARISDYASLQAGQSVDIENTVGIIALDGERELTVRRKEKWSITLSDQGPKRADIAAIMEQHTAQAIQEKKKC